MPALPGIECPLRRAFFVNAPPGRRQGAQKKFLTYFHNFATFRKVKSTSN
jgi:hypothetical protein